MTQDYELRHHGVKGMKWGRRKAKISNSASKKKGLVNTSNLDRLRKGQLTDVEKKKLKRVSDVGKNAVSIISGVNLAAGVASSSATVAAGLAAVSPALAIVGPVAAAVVVGGIATQHYGNYVHYMNEK